MAELLKKMCIRDRVRICFAAPWFNPDRKLQTLNPTEFPVRVFALQKGKDRGQNLLCSSSKSYVSKKVMEENTIPSLFYELKIANIIAFGLATHCAMLFLLPFILR